MRIASLIFLVLLCQCLNAQVVFNFEGNLDNNRASELKERFTNYHVFEASSEELFESLKNSSNPESVTFVFPGFDRWNFSLVSRNLVASNYFSKSSQGLSRGLTASEILTYGGKYNDSRAGDVALTVTGEMIYGFVEKENHTFYIEPLHYLIPGSSKNLFVVYDEHDVVDKGGTCAAHETAVKGNEMLPDVSNLGSARMSCYFLEIAVASDYSMFQKYGSVSAVEGHNFGVLNNVQTNYDNEFNEEILFDVVTSFTVNCVGCDPWTTSNQAGTLLSSFRSWGNGGGFGITYDNAGLWTDRNIASGSNSGVIGIAYLNGICNSNKYHVLEDYTSSAWGLRVLTAHEMGHNWSSGHDAANSGFIMAPSVNNTNTWSTQSQNSINNYLAQKVAQGCLEPCIIVLPPVADFSADVQDGCEPLTVNFFDNSINDPVSWSWQFPGGIPSVSTSQNPTVVYPNAGIFDVTLTVTNSAGTNSTSEINYISVSEIPFADFTYVISDRTIVLTNNSIGDEWLWDFGDGNNSTVSDPIHTYLDDGVYTVTLIASNSCGASTQTETVTIVTPPLPDFEANLTTGCAPLTVVFSDLSTSNTTNWDWIFPGGSPATSNVQFPVVNYNSPGTYDVTLEASNAAGTNVITKTNYITVLADPIAAFTYSVNGMSVDFTNSSSDANSYLWDFGDSNTSTEQDPTHIYSSGGSYSVVLTAFGVCDTVTITQQVDLTIPPAANANSDITSGCSPLTVNYSDQSTNNPTQWSWSFPGGNPSSSTNQNPSVTYNNTGTYNVQLIASNAAGADTVLLTDYISVSTIPNAGYNFVVNSTSASFTNSTSGADSYSWDFGDGNSSTETNPTHDFGMDGVYTVVLTATNSCGDDTFSQTITIATPPTAGATSDATSGCADLLVQFTDQSSPNTTSWSWSFPGGNPSSSTDQNPLVTYSSAGIYDVSLTVMNGTGTDVINLSNYITVTDIPNANFNNTINGTEVSFNNTSSDANSYVWDFGDGNSSTASNPVHDYAADGTYTVTLTATNGCGDDVVSHTIIIANLPNAGATSDVTSGCADLVVQFTDQSSPNTTSWEWNFPGGSPSTSTDQNPMVTYSNAGIFDVVLTASNATGMDVITLSNYITVSDVPVVSFSHTVNGTSASFNNSSMNADSYSWDFGDGNNSTEINPIHVYSSDGTYTATLTATNVCGDNIGTETVVISNSPTAGATANVTSGCAPLMIQFTDQSSSNTTSWLWTFSGGSPSTSTDQNPLITYNNPGVFDVVLEASNGVGTSTLVLTDYISIFASPTADFSIQANELNVDFTNASSNADIYLWDFGDGNSSTLENPNHSYATDGTYTVILTVTNNCGQDSHTQVVTVVSPPTAGFSVNQSSGCAPFVVQFSDQSSSNTTSWLWTFPGGTPSSSTDQNPTVTYESAGTFDVELVVSNAAGSSTSTEVNLISVGIGPEANFSHDILGLDVIYMSLSTGGDSYLWDFGDGSTSTLENPTHTYSSEDIFTVSLTVTNSCGTDVFTIPVNLTLAPLASFSYSANSGCQPLEVQFFDNSSGTVTEWNWTFPGGNPSSSTEQNPTVVYESAGVYDVTLEVSSSAGSNSLVQEEIIEVFPNPIADFSFSSSELDFVFLNNSQNGDSYLWDFGDGTTSDLENVEHTYSMDGQYEVTLTVTNSCGTNSFSSTVSAISPPTGAFSVANPVGCSPFTVTMVDESTSNVTNWNWTFEGGSPATSSIQNPTITYDIPGTYSITLEVSNSAGTYTVTRLDYIEVGTVPDAEYASIVNDNQVNFSNSSSNATSYLWDFGDGNSSTEENPVHVYSMNGSYEVTLTVSNNCGSNSVTSTILINEVSLPSAGFEADQNSGCSPLSVVFSNTSSDNTETWFWTFDGGVPANSTDESPTVIYDNEGVYSVSLVVGNSAGSDTLMLSDYIVVNGLPNSAFTHAGQDLQVDFSPMTVGANSYSWDFGDGNTSTAENPSHTFSDEGNYLVTLQITNDCGTTTSEQNIEVINGVSAPIAGFSSDVKEGCTDLTVSYIDNSSNEPDSWFWEFEGGNPASSTEQNPTVVYSTPGIFNVSLTASNSAGENTIVEESYINVDAAPTSDFSIEVLMDGNVEFTDQSDGAQTWAWDFGDGNTSNDQSPTHMYSQSGMYAVTLTVKNDCGETSSTQEINVVITSVSNFENALKLQLFPNPTKDKFQVVLESYDGMDIQLEVINTIGQTVRSDQFYLIGEQNRTYDLSSTANGTYFIKINSIEGSVVRKLIVSGK